MSDLTAIDILINPDEKTLEWARAVNAHLRQSVPSGFELDATHLPYITILQRYVRTADLEKVFEAIQKTIAETDMTSLTFRAVAIKHADWGFPAKVTQFILLSLVLKWLISRPSSLPQSILLLN